MQKIDELVLEVVKDFMLKNELFTALDVSNKIRQVLPTSRHREVRDLVRQMFATEIEPAGWARSPIYVTLPDGTSAEALLYHALADSWDLDTKYDAQKRSQSAITTPVVAAKVSGTKVVTLVPSVPAIASPPALSTRDLWDQLFKSQPSLFPRKS